MATRFNRNELEFCGEYSNFGTAYGAPYGDVKKLNSPITPRENLRRFFAGQPVEWMPDVTSDFYDITPDCVPDTIACGYEGGFDNFGVEWIPLENGLPAFVKPGLRLLEDIEDWRNLKFPDVDSWDWKGAKEGYAVSVSEGRFVRGILWSGYFERLISLMGFESAAMALVEDPEEVRAFFEALADMNIAIIDHYVEAFHPDCIMIHDDWASQQGPFFSLDTCMDIIVPPYKRMVDHVHALGLPFIAHCCGNATRLVPAMLAIGIDVWQYQDTAANTEEAVAACDGKIILESYAFPPDTVYSDELKETVLTLYRRFDRSIIYALSDPETFVQTDDMRRDIYEAGRVWAVENSTESKETSVC